MSLSIAIVGLPNVGKSTLFNALLKRQAALVANYPFATIEPNVGVVDVPDERLYKLAEIYKPEKITPAVVKFYDIAGLVEGAHKGEGLGNAFLSHIKETDAILHMVRAFNDENIVRAGSVNPVHDIEIINTELVLADLVTLQKRVESFQRELKKDPSKENVEKDKIYKILLDGFNKNKLGKDLGFNNEQLNYLKDLNLLTLKPKIYVLNVDEKDVNNESILNQVVGLGDAMIISAKIESEITSLAEDDRKIFMKELGLNESGLDKIIKKGFEILGLETYLTAGVKEVRAWTITKGTKAPQAAGKIHTDFERGFIKASVINFNDFMAFINQKKKENVIFGKNAGQAGLPDTALIKEGLIKLEGKEYVVKDGDIIEFHFNV